MKRIVKMPPTDPPAPASHDQKIDDTVIAVRLLSGCGFVLLLCFLVGLVFLLMWLF